MVGAFLQTLEDGFLGTSQVDEGQLFQILGKAIPIDLAKRRAGEEGMMGAVLPMFECFIQQTEPTPAVVILQRNSGCHFVTIGHGVEIIGIEKLSACCLGELTCHGALSTPGDAHHDEDAHDAGVPEAHVAGVSS